MYGQEVVMTMEYIVPIFRVVMITKMTDIDAIEKILLQLIHLEEEHFFAGFHQNVGNKRKKVWHDRHIKRKRFEVGGLVLMYDSKFFKDGRKVEKTLVRTICH